MLTVELSILIRRPRTWLLLAPTILLPSLFIAAMAGTKSATQTTDPVAYLATARHGWSVLQAPLLFGSPVFLPIVVAVVGGSAIGADSGSGYLRYLLVRPVDRTRLYLSKQTACAVFCVAVVAVLLVVGAVGAASLPHPSGAGPFALSADGTVAPLSVAAYLGRTAIAACHLAAWLTALASIGVLAGSLTRSAVGGVAGAVGYHLVCTVLTQLSFLRALRPALLPYWLGRWTTVGRVHPRWADIAGGIGCALGYVVLTGLVGVLVLRRRDITE